MRPTAIRERTNQMAKRHGRPSPHYRYEHYDPSPRQAGTTVVRMH
jgi:hypothetical protein